MGAYIPSWYLERAWARVEEDMARGPRIIFPFVCCGGIYREGAEIKEHMALCGQRPTRITADEIVTRDGVFVERVWKGVPTELAGKVA